MRNMDISKSLFTFTVLLFLTGCGGGGGSAPTQNTQTSNNNASSLTTEGSTQNKEQSTNTNGSISKLNTAANAQDLTASKDALFVAEGDKGVEILKIGYQDRIEHEVVATIPGINAKHVSLSNDQTKLYVENNQGFINIFDISDIKSPRKERIVTKQSLQVDPITEDGRYQFTPKDEKGLYVYDISNPSNKNLLVKYTKSPVYDITLVDHDTKAIVATKSHGIDILKIDDIDHIKVIANEPIDGNVLGVSINKSSGLLFVANGDKGIKVYNLNLLLDSLL